MNELTSSTVVLGNVKCEDDYVIGVKVDGDEFAIVAWQTVWQTLLTSRVSTSSSQSFGRQSGDIDIKFQRATMLRRFLGLKETAAGMGREHTSGTFQPSS